MRIVPLLLIVILLMGCAHTRTLNLDAMQEPCCTLILTDGQHLDVTGLEVREDSTTWIDPDTRHRQTVATSHIEWITHKVAGKRRTVPPSAFVREANPQSWLSKINRLGAKKTATVFMVDGQRFKVKHLRIAPDSTSWQHQSTGRFETVTTRAIQSLQFKRRGQGALEGMVIGSLALAATGAISGYAEGDEEPCRLGEFCGCLGGWCGPETAEGKAFEGAIGGVIVGGTLGALVGAFLHNKYTYRLEIPRPPREPAITVVYTPPHRKAPHAPYRQH